MKLRLSLYVRVIPCLFPRCQGAAARSAPSPSASGGGYHHAAPPVSAPSSSLWGSSSSGGGSGSASSSAHVMQLQRLANELSDQLHDRVRWARSGRMFPVCSGAHSHPPPHTHTPWCTAPPCLRGFVDGACVGVGGACVGVGGACVGVGACVTVRVLARVLAWVLAREWCAVCVHVCSPDCGVTIVFAGGGGWRAGGCACTAARH
jgi:hypothetical protein